MNILKINNLSYAYHTLNGEIPALYDINLDIKANEFISIVGPSGCGKSTLLSLIAGLLKPDFGNINFESTKKIGYMFQKDNLLEWYSVYKNANLGLKINKCNTASNVDNINNLFKDYGLYEFRNVRPSQLSGGMRQRAALIRTLVLKPDILLLDEPFSALDYQTRLEVCDDISKKIKAEKKTAILVTHDLSEAITMGDRVVILSSRPATIKKVIPITFEKQGLSPLQKRNTQEFNEYFSILWKELGNHEIT